MDRLINIDVHGNFVHKDNKNAGVQGEANVTKLHITFSEDWEGFGKRIVWRDAQGENPVAIVLSNTLEVLRDDQDPLVFETTIPGEPLAFPGWCSFTIEGFRKNDEAAVAISVTDSLLVKQNDTYNTPPEPSMTEGEQIHAEMEELREHIDETVSEALDAVENAEKDMKVWEVWDEEKLYQPLNKVSYMGSSYICLATCKGINPAHDVTYGITLPTDAASITGIFGIRTQDGKDNLVTVVDDNGTRYVRAQAGYPGADTGLVLNLPEQYTTGKLIAKFDMLVETSENPTNNISQVYAGFSDGDNFVGNLFVNQAGGANQGTDWESTPAAHAYDTWYSYELEVDLDANTKTLVIKTAGGAVLGTVADAAIANDTAVNMMRFTAVTNGDYSGAAYLVRNLVVDYVSSDESDTMSWSLNDQIDDIVESRGKEGHFWLLIAARGDRGERGIRGPQGVTGATGGVGPRGPQGLEGPEGIQGPSGRDGVSGIAFATDGYMAFNVTEDGHLQCSYTNFWQEKVDRFAVVPHADSDNAGAYYIRDVMIRYSETATTKNDDLEWSMTEQLKNAADYESLPSSSAGTFGVALGDFGYTIVRKDDTKPYVVCAMTNSSQNRPMFEFHLPQTVFAGVLTAEFDLKVSSNNQNAWLDFGFKNGVGVEFNTPMGQVGSAEHRINWTALNGDRLHENNTWYHYIVEVDLNAKTTSMTVSLDGDYRCYLTKEFDPPADLQPNCYINDDGHLCLEEDGATFDLGQVTSVGRSMAGKTVQPTAGETVTAGTGAEIFNDYRTRTWNGSSLMAGNVASGNYSHAEGYVTTASGSYAHTEGNYSEATSSSAHAEGEYTLATGVGSHVEGSESSATNYASHAEGQNTSASGNSSHSEGMSSSASGDFSHAEGHTSTASGDSSHAEGYNTKAVAAYCHAEGYGTTAGKSLGGPSVYDCIGTHAEGYFTNATGRYSHAEGYSTNATGDYSHAEGYSSTANTTYSHAEGYSSTASGPSSHAEGSSTKADGQASHAEGFLAEANGHYSHSEGYCITSDNFASHAQGKYNKAMTTGGSTSNTVGDAMVIGNGTSANDLSNAFRVTFAGETYGLSAFNASGADYAEFFEWADGNADAEDRIGYFVTPEGKQLRKAEPGDYILGIVSGNPCIIGNADEDWLGRWEKDAFGRFVREQVESPVTELREVEVPVLDENGEPTGAATTEWLEVETGEVIVGWRYKQNPDYDAAKPYVERKDRKEWDCVGMLGVLAVRDDGSCTVGGFCRVAEGGTATAADGYVSGQTYRVIDRVTDNIVKVVFR